MSNILEIKNLTKKYYNKTALSGIDVCLERGKICGLMGPNGSGKTTLMKVIIGLHKQTSGDVIINDIPLSYKTKAMVSYMPTENFLYDNFKVKDTVKYYTEMYRDFSYDNAMQTLDKINVDKDFKVGKLSSGLKNKLKVTLALSRNVDLYLLDEPLNGVDVLARDAILELLVNSYDENKTIIVSSHLVGETEKIFDTVMFLKDGQIVLQGDAEALRIEKGMSIENIYKEVFR